MRFLRLLISILFLPLIVISQVEIDSIERLLPSTFGSKKITLLNRLSVLYQVLSPQQSLQNAQKALVLAEKEHDEKLHAISLDNVGSAYYILGENDKAIAFYLRALTINEKQNNLKGLSCNYNNIGNVYYQLGEWKKALSYYKRSLEVDEKLGDKIGLAGSYNNIANILVDNKELIEAIPYYNKALKIGRQLGDSSMIAAVINSIGLQYLASGDLSGSLLQFKEALRINLALGNMESSGLNQQNIARVYNARHDFKTAAEYYVKSSETGKEFIYLVSENYRDLAKLYAQQMNYRLAYDYILEHHALKDSIFNEKNVRGIQELETKFETEKKDKEIQVLLRDSNIKDLTLSRNRIIITSTAVGLIFICIVAFILYNRNKIKQDANIQLSIANAEIHKKIAEKEMLMKEVHHRVKNNLQLISSLLNWQTENVEDETVLRIIDEGRSRVKSMALIHEYLYQHDNLTEIDIRKYFDNLLDYLNRTYSNTDNIQMETSIVAVSLDTDITIPLGLIVNELVSNAFKYAFQGRSSGLIAVRLKQLHEQSNYELTVIDDGVGLPGDYKERKTDSLGLQLVETLVRQLKGSMEVVNTNGTCFRICFTDRLRDNVTNK